MKHILGSQKCLRIKQSGPTALRFHLDDLVKSMPTGQYEALVGEQKMVLSRGFRQNPYTVEIEYAKISYDAEGSPNPVAILTIRQELQRRQQNFEKIFSLSKLVKHKTSSKSLDQQLNFVNFSVKTSGRFYFSIFQLMNILRPICLPDTSEDVEKGEDEAIITGYMKYTSSDDMQKPHDLLSVKVTLMSYAKCKERLGILVYFA